MALRTLHDPDDAADALQEAMISAFRRAADFRGEAAVTTWLHRIVVNACLDQLRRRAARPTVPAENDAVLDVLGRRAGGPAPDPAPASDVVIDVAAALQLLPDAQRAALVLVDMLGFSVATAANLLAVSPGTVKSRCARGRAALLPHVAHLRESRQPEDEKRNRAATGNVSPSQPGEPAPPAAAAALPGGLLAGRANPGQAAGTADQQATGEGGSTDHDRSS